MKTILYISIFTLLLLSCDKDKSDARKMVGTWKMELVDGFYGSIISTDTISIDKKHFLKNNVTYDFRVENNYLFLLNNGDTSCSFCYNFINDNQFKLDCFQSPGGNYIYILNKVL